MHNTSAVHIQSDPDWAGGQPTTKYMNPCDVKTNNQTIPWIKMPNEPQWTQEDRFRSSEVPTNTIPDQTQHTQTGGFD